MKRLDAYIAEIYRETCDKGVLRVFDMDDTLLRTDGKVKVTHDDGNSVKLTPKMFANYQRLPGDKFDYSEFYLLINPKPIKWMMRIFEAVYASQGPSGLVIATIRDTRTKQLIMRHFDNAGFSGIEVHPLGPVDDRINVAKSEWIADRVVRDELHTIHVFDDSTKTIEACNALNKPGFASVVCHRIVHNRISSLWE